MFQNLFSPLRSTMKALSMIMLLGVFGFVSVRAQEVAASRPVLDFDGNKVFAKQELLDIANQCIDRVLEPGKAYETYVLDYCLHKVLTRIQVKGYLQAQFGKTLYEQKENVLKATIPVTEGALYRVGEIRIENTKVLAPAQILDVIDLKTGDIADGAKLGNAMFERVKEVYSKLGYIQYTADITPAFHLKEGAEEGVADFVISVEEGAQFRIRSIKFTGADTRTVEVLRRELMVRDGEVFNNDLFTESINRMNNAGLYKIDPDRDVDYQTNEKSAWLDLTIRLRERVASSEPRQD